MARLLSGRLALLAVVLLAVCCSRPVAAIGKTPPGEPSDVKYIMCDVCKIVAKQIMKKYEEQKETLGKKFKEEHLIDSLESMTRHEFSQGRWLMQVNLVEEGDKLKAIEMDTAMSCGRMCKTVRMAADKIIADHDTDIAERVYKGDMDVAKLTKWLCYKLSNACTKKAPPLPADRPTGPEWAKMDPEEEKVTDTLASMKDSGLGGEVFTRDEAIKKYMGLADDEDLDDLDPEDLPEDMRGMYADLIKQGKISNKPTSKAKASQPPSSSMGDTVSKLVDQAQDTLSWLSKEAAPHLEQAKQQAAKLMDSSKQQAAKLMDKAGGFLRGLMGEGVDNAPQAEL